MAATLKDIVSQLKNNQKSSDLTSKNVNETTSAVKKLTDSIDKSFTMFFQQRKAERLNTDPLEAASEARNKSKLGKSFEAGQQAGQNFFGGGGLGSYFLPLLAALPLAIAGLRGWEVPVIKKLASGLVSSVSKLADNFKLRFASGFDNITRGILQRFGINPQTGRMARDALGRFTGKELKSTSVMISEAFDLLRLNVTRAFGVGADGGKIGRLASKAGQLMSVIINPFISISKGIGGWMTGSGARMLGFLSGVMGISGGVANIGKFAGFVGKILKPLGFLFSAYDGVMAFMNTEGSFMDKFVAGIGAFIGDFVGAPLDLLKSIVAWALEKLGFEEVAKLLKSWSFETIINDAIRGIWNMIKSAVDWVNLLFTDPGKALSDLFWGYIELTSGVYKTIGEWIYNIAVKPLWTWFENTFPDLSAWISKTWNDAIGYGGDLGMWIWNNSIGPLVNWIKDKFGGIPEYFGIGEDPTEVPEVPPPQTQAPGQVIRDGVVGRMVVTQTPKGAFSKFVPDDFQPVQLPTDPRLNIVPKPTGKALGDQQSALDELRSRGPRGANLVANSGNTNIKQGDTVINNFGAGGTPSPFDPRTDLSRAWAYGYGSRG